jgi:hypothetical protein
MVGVNLTGFSGFFNMESVSDECEIWVDESESL